jgi:hypothetical protein
VKVILNVLVLMMIESHSIYISSYDDTALLLSEMSDVVYSKQLIDIILALMCSNLNCMYMFLYSV